MNESEKEKYFLYTIVQYCIHCLSGLHGRVSVFSTPLKESKYVCLFMGVCLLVQYAFVFQLVVMSYQINNINTDKM